MILKIFKVLQLQLWGAGTRIIQCITKCANSKRREPTASVLVTIFFCNGVPDQPKKAGEILTMVILLIYWAKGLDKTEFAPKLPIPSKLLKRLGCWRGTITNLSIIIYWNFEHPRFYIQTFRFIRFHLPLDRALQTFVKTLEKLIQNLVWVEGGSTDAPPRRMLMYWSSPLLPDE